MNLQDNPEEYKDYAYADSISGGDFTVTLSDLFSKGLDVNGNYISPQDQLFALRIKESALTRITIIDERLHKSSLNKFPWLALKNIRVLNHNSADEKIAEAIKIIDVRDLDWEKQYIQELSDAFKIALGLGVDMPRDLTVNIQDMISNLNTYVIQVLKNRPNKERLTDMEKKDISYVIASYISNIDTIKMQMIFEGNSFRDNLDSSHFLTIHLGLLEKILKNSI